MKKVSSLKNLISTLETRPLIVGTLTGDMSVEDQIRTAKKADVDLIELRFDTFPLRAGIYMMQVLPKKSPKPVLLTWRTVKEGGNPRYLADIEKTRRMEILNWMVPFCRLLDVEIRSPLLKELTALAHAKKCGVVHSVHDFKRLPGATQLNKWARTAVSLKGDFFKAAVMTKNSNEVRQFLTWGTKCPHPRPALIAMGDEGVASRVIGYCFGSSLTFGHLGSEAAPGQLHVDELASRVRNIFKPLKEVHQCIST